MTDNIETLDVASMLSDGCLMLEGEGITDDNITQLVPILLSGRVKVLDFTNTQTINDTACQVLANVLPKTNVKELGLSCCYNINMKILSAGFRQSQITVLNLDATNTSGPDLSLLMSCLPKYIRHLSVTENAGDESSYRIHVARGIVSLRDNITMTTFISEYYSSNGSESGGRDTDLIGYYSVVDECIDSRFADHIFFRNTCIQQTILASVHTFLLIKRFPKGRGSNSSVADVAMKGLVSMPYDVVKIIAQILFSTRNETVWKRVLSRAGHEENDEWQENVMETIFRERMKHGYNTSSEDDTE